MRKLGEGCGVVLCSEALSVLQLRAANEPLLPNLKALQLCSVAGESIPFIPLFLSPRTTVINIEFDDPYLSKVMLASMITTLPTLCPNLQDITLSNLPGDPMITTAVSEMLLATNQNALRRFHVDSPLTEVAREVIYKLPGLRDLSVVIGKETPLPPAMLPNLTNLIIEYNYDSRWLQMFHGAVLRRLEAVTFYSESKRIDDFLEAFESVTLTTSIPTTLSKFEFYTSRPWRPNYRSLLPFAQLKELVIKFSCKNRCSSTIGDDIITDITRAMPRLEILPLGGEPCRTPTGVTAKGLATLAYYCLHLSTLRIHFQVASLHPPTVPGAASFGEPAIPRGDCALKILEVGDVPVAEESTTIIVLTLLRIFPRIAHIRYLNEGWRKVADAISLSKRLVDRLSKKSSLAPLRSKVDDTSSRTHA